MTAQRCVPTRSTEPCGCSSAAVQGLHSHLVQREQSRKLVALCCDIHLRGDAEQLHKQPYSHQEVAILNKYLTGTLCAAATNATYKVHQGQGKQHGGRVGAVPMWPLSVRSPHGPAPTWLVPSLLITPPFSTTASAPTSTMSTLRKGVEGWQMGASQAAGWAGAASPAC